MVLGAPGAPLRPVGVSWSQDMRLNWQIWNAHWAGKYGKIIIFNLFYPFLWWIHVDAIYSMLNLLGVVNCQCHRAKSPTGPVHRCYMLLRREALCKLWPWNDKSCTLECWHPRTCPPGGIEKMEFLQTQKISGQISPVFLVLIIPIDKKNVIFHHIPIEIADWKYLPTFPYYIPTLNLTVDTFSSG